MRFDAIELEIFKNIFHSIAEEMGAALRRTAFSPNIKERRDYSCAVFDADGAVIAMGDHMPVHLGSMPMSVRAALDRLQFAPGDVAMVNDPFCGGTHLPDITLVAPFYASNAGARRQRPRQGRHSEASGIARERRLGVARAGEPQFFVAARAHHADVGGAYAGSMGLCREIYQEGLRIPPVKLLRGGQIETGVLSLVLSNVRTPEEREGDLGAQIAACRTGLSRLQEVCSRYGAQVAARAAGELLDYSERMMRAFILQVPPGIYQAEDFLDDDGVSDRPIRIAVKISFARRRQGKLVRIDFSGSDAQVEGAVNAVEAITWSSCFYVFRSLLAEDVPATAGLMRQLEIIAPAGTVVNARPPAAVAGGNVETSQRLVDVLLLALAKAVPGRIPAASSGTMNNLTIGGFDPRTKQPFAYYETVAGGMGARPGKPGVSGVHTHMTNSLNTPAEALEYAYPLRVTRYSLRPGSGGRGRHRGGDGVVREIEVLSPSDVTLLAERRRFPPYGLSGGAPGRTGEQSMLRRDGSIHHLPGKFSTRMNAGDRIRISSPGAGGYGKET
jgi:N-methylhydantoinase B